MLALFSYQDPLITQYQIQESRAGSGSEEINFGESYGELVFGFSDFAMGSFQELPESLGYIDLNLVSFDALENRSDVIKELEFSSVTREANPKLFDQGNFLDKAQDFKGIKTLDRTTDIALKNNIWAE